MEPGEQVVVLGIHIHHQLGVYAIWDMSKCMSMYIMLSICDVMYVCVHACVPLSLSLHIYIYICICIYLLPLSLMIAIYPLINSLSDRVQGETTLLECDFCLIALPFIKLYHGELVPPRENVALIRRR